MDPIVVWIVISIVGLLILVALVALVVFLVRKQRVAVTSDRRATVDATTATPAHRADSRRRRDDATGDASL